MAGDLSPLTIEAAVDGRREAPPALVVAVALGLGSVDMPIPSVADWEWLNWRFPRAVRAGDTVYARWTLTQKRPPVGGAPASIVVWRVDVHTADGVLCAEGEVGAKVKRAAVRPPQAEPSQAAPAPQHRRRRRSRANGTVPEPPPVAAPPAAEAKPERTTGGSRRRRRRRPSGSAARDEEHEPRAAHVQETAPPPAAEPPPAMAAPAPTPRQTAASRKGLGGVLRRLRRP